MDNTHILYLIIPAYNEEANIERVVKEWHEVVVKTGEKSRLVIVNDGSKDNTGALLQKCAAALPQLIALDKTNSGHGGAVLYGYRYALENGAGYIFQTDSDGQTLPHEFWSFWEEREQYAMILGYRRFRGDGLGRFFVTKILRIMLFLFFHVWIKDANTPFRLLRARELRSFIDLVPANYFLANTLLSVIYQKKRESIRFITITFRKRQGGINSINIHKIMKIGLSAISDFRRLNRALDKTSCTGGGGGLNAAEFDAYAEDFYDQVKSAMGPLGRWREASITYKKEHLDTIVKGCKTILDFGCGSGLYTEYIKKWYPELTVTGIDVSKAFIDMARKKATGCLYSVIKNPEELQKMGNFDCIFINCVLHHIPHTEHKLWLCGLSNILNAGGKLIIMEMNPYAPLVQILQRTNKYEGNAVLLLPSYCRKLIASFLTESAFGYTFIFPWRGAFFRFIEKIVRVIPFGLQYYVVMRHPGVAPTA
ncbi:MAG: glycosyltransferase [Spirochaetaceae bacterium]|jgi:2-polyprenyl-3-methyl-5-hydroxy-6-metoxy-1,4-benzoquinol methylase|nr:glycosyltransferase [Spirochaetaceae bacterium]